MSRALCLCVLGFAAAACSDARELERGEIDAIAHRHEHELDAFHRAQVEFAEHNPVPKELDLHRDGTILIHECALAGYPERGELRLQFTYVNTTGHTIDTARVTITLRDPESDTEWSQTMDLELPLGFRMTPQSSYTTHVEIPTREIEKHPGWTWRMRAEARVRVGAASRRV